MKKLGESEMASPFIRGDTIRNKHITLIRTILILKNINIHVTIVFQESTKICPDLVMQQVK